MGFSQAKTFLLQRPEISIVWCKPGNALVNDCLVQFGQELNTIWLLGHVLFR